MPTCRLRFDRRSYSYWPRDYRTAEFRFAEKEVYIHRDPISGDVVLSRRPSGWEDYFQLVETLGIPQDFMADRRDAPPQVRSEL